MAEQIEQLMRQVKLGGMAKGFAEPELRKDYRGVVRAVAANK